MGKIKVEFIFHNKKKPIQFSVNWVSGFVFSLKKKLEIALNKKIEML